jgi:hypothetical protein
MPSGAKNLFSGKLIGGVAKLIDTHNELNPPGRGKRQLTHITHAGVLMLCAAWELYVEEVVAESATFLVRDAASPDFLPDRIKGKIAQVAKNDPHNHGALKLCGEGWKELYVNAAKSACAKLNTPKFGSVSELFYDWLDIKSDELAASWRHDSAELNAFVTLRGEIAHRGADAPYVRRDKLKECLTMIEMLAVDTDNFLARHLKALSHNGRRPWNVSPIPHS